ncbi:g8021 [Coccomyxa viridis]|uniref:G8021 protein n=1 Tax=Coccomyxa viridis TaxID=1274662 RepID=A0ABP1FZB9_9CHLO
MTILCIVPVRHSTTPRPGRVVVWRLLHGKLFVGAFHRHIHRGTPESHLCPHAACQESASRRSACSGGAGCWVTAVHVAANQCQTPWETGQLSMTWLRVASCDRRGPWQPAAGLDSLWQRLRLLVITQLWDAYCRARSRPEQPTQPAHIAARVISAARIQVRRDWLLVGSDIRLRAGVLSHWLRGRQPTMTEAFQSRWCHGEVLCSRPAEVTEPPHMHWTAAHPVPLPR